jgi:hypothetical protein
MIGQLLELAIPLLTAQTVVHKAKRSVKEVAVKAAAAAIAVVGLAFLLAALWTYLSTIYTALIASMAIGVGLLVIAGLVAVIGLAMVREPVVPPAPQADLAAIAQDIIAQFEVDFSRKGTPTKSVGAALAAGFALGRLVTR